MAITEDELLRVSGADWAALSARHRGTLMNQVGFQGTSAGKQIPFTSAGAALPIFRFWQNALPAIVIAAQQEGKNIPLEAIQAAAGIPLSNGLFVSFNSQPSSLAIAGMLIKSDDIGVKNLGRQCQASLIAMAGAMAGGFFTRSPDGFLCMPLANAARFWDGVSGLAISYGTLAAHTSISVADALEAALQGAKEGLENVATKAGELAGGAANLVGTLAGKIGSGLFDGLGIVNVAVLAGGGYLAYRVVY